MKTGEKSDKLLQAGLSNHQQRRPLRGEMPRSLKQPRSGPTAHVIWGSAGLTLKYQIQSPARSPLTCARIRWPGRSSGSCARNKGMPVCGVTKSTSRFADELRDPAKRPLASRPVRRWILLSRSRQSIAPGRPDSSDSAEGSTAPRENGHVHRRSVEWHPAPSLFRHRPVRKGAFRPWRLALTRWVVSALSGILIRAALLAGLTFCPEGTSSCYGRRSRTEVRRPSDAREAPGRVDSRVPPILALLHPHEVATRREGRVFRFTRVTQTRGVLGRWGSAMRHRLRISPEVLSHCTVCAPVAGPSALQEIGAMWGGDQNNRSRRGRPGSPGVSDTARLANRPLPVTAAVTLAWHPKNIRGRTLRQCTKGEGRRRESMSASHAKRSR